VDRSAPRGGGMAAAAARGYKPPKLNSIGSPKL